MNQTMVWIILPTPRALPTTPWPPRPSRSRVGGSSSGSSSSAPYGGPPPRLRASSAPRRPSWSERPALKSTSYLLTQRVLGRYTRPAGEPGRSRRLLPNHDKRWGRLRFRDLQRADVLHCTAAGRQGGRRFRYLP